MNYVELHIGDFEKATAHLTACEDGIYGRLLRRYYDTEAPLGLDLSALQRLVRARTRDEKQAVQTILEEFFQKADDGWHHSRCDEVLEKFKEQQEDKDLEREHEADRKRRYRQRRAELFAQLRELNIVPPFDTAMTKLEDMLSRTMSHGTGAGHVQGRPGNATAIHTPIPNPQSPEEQEQTEAHTNGTTGDDPAGGVCDPPSTVVQAAILLRKRGCLVTPQNPDLIEAIREGVKPSALDAMAELYPGKPANYVITAARRQRAEGATKLTETTHANGTSGRKLSAAEQVQQAIIERRQREAGGTDAPLAAIGH